MPRAALLLLALPAAAALLAASCQGFPDVVPCPEIPAGGCPIGRGGTCDDPTCAALYDCVDGKWVFTQRCAAGDGGPEGGPGDGGGEGGPCTPIHISTPGQITGCTPNLEVPDCPVEAAQGSCAETVCLTGCLDFYMCAPSGWQVVAHCDDQGNFSSP